MLFTRARNHLHLSNLTGQVGFYSCANLNSKGLNNEHANIPNREKSLDTFLKWLFSYLSTIYTKRKKPLCLKGLLLLLCKPKKHLKLCSPPTFSIQKNPFILGMQRAIFIPVVTLQMSVELHKG